VGFRIRDALLEDLPALGNLAGQLVRLHHGFDPGRWMLPEGVEAGYARYFASQSRQPPAPSSCWPRTKDSHEMVGYAYASLEERNGPSCAMTAVGYTTSSWPSALAAKAWPPPCYASASTA